MTLPDITPTATAANITKAMQWTVILLTAAYVILLILEPRLGPWDEFVFLPTLQSGIPLPFTQSDNYPYVNFNALGRFFPLAFQEFNLIGIYLSNNPFWYFFAIAMQLVVLVLLFNVLVKKFIVDDALRYFGLIVLIISPGFVTSFFELRILERPMMIFILGFLVCYLAFAKSKNYLMFFLALAFANLSLYYKEPAFIIVATFSFFHLIFTWNSLSTREKLLDVALIASAIIFLALYVIIMLPKQASVLYTFSTDGQLFSHARNVINYALFSDPVPLLLVCPLALWRIYVIAKRIDSPHGILDPLLFAGAAYTVGHLILNIYAPYYLFPVWVMGVPPALYFYSKTRRNIGLFWKAMAYMVAAIFVLNAIPLTAHTLTYDKYLAINFDQTINFLAHDIKQRHADERVNVFLDGVNREAGRGTYFVFGEYLKYKGLSVRDFNLCSTDKRESLLPLQTKPSPFDKKNEIDELSDKFGYPNKFFPYSVMQPGGATDIQKNDYLIVTPQSPNDVDQKYVAELERNYDLLFHTSSRFAVPNVGAKALVKMLISRFLGEEQSKTVMHTRNIMDWPNYYVFVKR